MGSSATINRIWAVCLFLAICLGSSLSASQRCTDGSVLIVGKFGEARFTVELADEPEERSRGLMHRESMARSAGMLFVYEHPQPAAFWMKNTLIPLDMIFTDSTGRIVHIHENAIPHDETPIPGGNDVFAVLEINGGLSAKFGIKTGDTLVHRAFFEGPSKIPCKE